jgi:hypothetical protein
MGLFQPNPPSQYWASSIVMGEKNVRAAEVARAACHMSAGIAGSVSVSYDRNLTGTPPVGVGTATTNDL